jgi:hypothetical protein
MWCDILSINAHDKKEKSAQVALLPVIYRKAKQVIAWLGTSGDEGDEAKHVVLRCLAAERAQPEPAKRPDGDRLYRSKLRHTWDPQWDDEDRAWYAWPDAPPCTVCRNPSDPEDLETMVDPSSMLEELQDIAGT